MVNPGPFRKILNFMPQLLKDLYVVTTLEFTYKQTEGTVNTSSNLTAATGVEKA